MSARDLQALLDDLAAETQSLSTLLGLVAPEEYGLLMCPGVVTGAPFRGLGHSSGEVGAVPAEGEHAERDHGSGVLKP